MSDYDTDFYAWVQKQAAALRAKGWLALDVTNLLGEVESLAERQRSAIEHQLDVTHASTFDSTPVCVEDSLISPLE